MSFLSFWQSRVRDGQHVLWHRNASSMAGPGARRVLCASLMLGLLAGCQAPAALPVEAGQAGIDQKGLYGLSSRLWPQAAIAVCWENGSPFTALEQDWVRNTVETTWSAKSGVSFVGWSNCVAGARGIRIRIEDTGRAPHTVGLGTDIDGQIDGMSLNFTFQNWSPSCQNTREMCIRAIAAHEFGHALGFDHEQNRPDTPPACIEGSYPPGYGDLTLGAWDTSSVMNYCNPTWNNDGQLSAGDMRGLQEVYGLLANPDGSRHDLWGWNVPENGGDGWFADGSIFITSYSWGRRSQTIDLYSRGFDASLMADAPPIEVSEQFARVFCPDDYYLKVQLLDTNMNVVRTFDTGAVHQTGPCDYTLPWETVRYIFKGYGPGVRYVRWEDGGIDSEYWAGHYGTAMRNAVLKVTAARAGLASVSRSAGNLEVFSVGRASHMQQSQWSSTAGWNMSCRAAGAGVAPAGAVIAAVARRPGNLDTFFIGNDGAVYTNWWNDSVNTWSTFRLSAPGLAPPGGGIAGVARQPGNLDVFFIGNDGAVYSSWWNNVVNAWSTFRLSDPGLAPPGGAITATARTGVNLDVFFIGNDGAVYSSWWAQNPWSTFRLSDPGIAPAGGGIAATARTTGNLDVFFIGNDGGVYSSRWAQNPWSTFRLSDPGLAPAGGGIAATARTTGNLDVFFIGNDGGVYSSWWAQNPWSTFRLSDPGISPAGGSIAATARSAGNLDVFFLGRDGSLRTSWWNYSPWSTARVGAYVPACE